MFSDFVLKITLAVFCVFAINCVYPQKNNIPIQQESEQISEQVSNANIKAFCQDSLGYMWIATPRGLNRYNGYEYIQYFHNPSDSNSLNNDFVLSLFLDSSNRLWIGTSTGVDCYNFEYNHFEHYPDTENRSHYVHSFYEDHQRKIWVATAKGAAIIDEANKKVVLQKATEGQSVNLFWEDNSKNLWMGLNSTEGLAFQRNINEWSYLSIAGMHGECIYTDPQGNWWVGTNNGIWLYNPVNQTYKRPTDKSGEQNLINNTQVNFIKEISPLKLLIGTNSQGIFLYDIVSQTLQHDEPSQLTAIKSTQLQSCYIDRDKNVWLGSFDKGFMVWNNSLNYFNPDQRLSNTFRNKFVTRIAEDAYGNLWIGTRYDGLYCYRSDGKYTVINSHNSTLFDNGNYLIESLFIDSENRIWIGLTDGLAVAHLSENGDIRIIYKKKIRGVFSIKQDVSGNYWLGSISGLCKIERNKLDQEPEFYFVGNVPDLCILENGDILFSGYEKGAFLLERNKTSPVQILSDVPDAAKITKHCITIFKDKQNGVWLGSYGAGCMFLPITNFNGYRIYDKRDGLPSNDILCFESDSQGDIWMSTSYGISRYRASDSTFVSYFSSDGTLGDQYHEKAGLRTRDGLIFFSGNHGITFFNPKANRPVKSLPTIHLTDLKILNKSIMSSYKFLGNTSLPFVKQITLSHTQTVISIDYAGIDFLFNKELTYAYRLEGFDKNWNFTGNYRRATYSNLSPGEYTFKVKAVNGEGLKSITPASIKIKVLPAPWFSWPAWIAYILILATSTYLIFWLILKARISKHQLETEHLERKREKQISEMKMNFFTNISHELRTPLTLISAPLDRLSSSQKLDKQNAHLLDTVSRNVNSMLRLINQLLDFNRMEGGTLDLVVQQTDIIRFINNIVEVFSQSAVGKHITLNFNPHVPSLLVWIDTDKLEKILYNLLSNALKFTPPKGKIEIVTRELGQQESFEKYEIGDNTCLEIKINDSGPGIPEDKLPELFIRYRQIDGPGGQKPDYSGSGIGLHYTKRLTEMHHGNIKAMIREEGGMTFSFILPIGDVYPESNKIALKKSYPANPEIVTAKKDETESHKEHRYTILVAEDNAELMDFIHELLGNQYELIEAMDGNKAWNLVQSKSPDLVLSDVLMPGLSGYELCRNIKQHPQYSHIPIILLTAKSTVNDQLQGLEQGADVYICKPFNSDYLLLTIKNLFMGRDRLRKYLSTPRLLNKEEPAEPVKLNIHDQKFVEKLTKMLEQELANAELNINMVARDLGFSRTGFYRKIKGLFDLSPSDFIRIYRLKRAAEMIQENSLSLNEIATYSGFNFYPHFSKLFKKQFGVSPKDYLQEHKSKLIN